MYHRCPHLFRHLTSLFVVAIAVTISMATFVGMDEDYLFERGPFKFKCEAEPPASYVYNVETIVKSSDTQEPLPGATVSFTVSLFSSEATGETDDLGNELCEEVGDLEYFIAVTNQAGVVNFNTKSYTWDSKSDQLIILVRVAKAGWLLDCGYHKRVYDNSQNTDVSSTFYLSPVQWKFE